MLYYQIILLIYPSFLLPKCILSPKCISPVLKSLSPGVNRQLYHHSAETETHIHFSSEIAETFDLLGFFRQKADCFNMPGPREHVHANAFFHLISMLCKVGKVPCQGFRIAGDIDHFSRLQAHQGT